MMGDDTRRAINHRSQAARELHGHGGRVWAKAVYTLFLVSLAAALLEGSARVYEKITGGPIGALAILRPNPRGTGSYRVKTNLRVTAVAGGTPVLIRTNAHGMPGDEVETAKVPGSKRVAFVGDSFTFGLWASHADKSFVGQIAARAPAALEVLNFGVGGFGFGDIELLLREEIAAFVPDYVVLVSFNGNDFRDTYLGIDRYDVSSGTAVTRDEVLERMVPEQFRPASWNSSVAGTAGYRLLRAAQRGLAAARANRQTPVESPGRAFTVDSAFTSYTFWSRVPYPPVATAARDSAIQALIRIDSLVARMNATLFLVTLPFREQVHSVKTEGAGFDTSLPQRFIEEFATAHRVAYLDLLPPMRAFVRQTPIPIYVRGDAHLNDLGHELAGRLIGDWLASHLDWRVSKD